MFAKFQNWYNNRVNGENYFNLKTFTSSSVKSYGKNVAIKMFVAGDAYIAITDLEKIMLKLLHSDKNNGMDPKRTPILALKKAIRCMNDHRDLLTNARENTKLLEELYRSCIKDTKMCLKCAEIDINLFYGAWLTQLAGKSSIDQFVNLDHMEFDGFTGQFSDGIKAFENIDSETDGIEDDIFKDDCIQSYRPFNLFDSKGGIFENQQETNSDDRKGAIEGILKLANEKKNPKGEEYNFKCLYSLCGKRFKRQEHLKRHMNVHTGSRPHKCKFPGCRKSFSRKDNMQQHLKMHGKKKNLRKINTRLFD